VNPRPTDLAFLAPRGWESADPTFGERYTAAPDLPREIEFDAAAPEPDITNQRRTLVQQCAPSASWRCPTCGQRTSEAATVGATTPEGEPAAYLLTFPACGHAFRVRPGQSIFRTTSKATETNTSTPTDSRFTAAALREAIAFAHKALAEAESRAIDNTDSAGSRYAFEAGYLRAAMEELISKIEPYAAPERG
jgi:hypothetical protein